MFTSGFKLDNNLSIVADKLEKASQVTKGDMLYSAQGQRTRILERTQRGVDVDEVAFHPYSTRGPVYYYPSKNAKNRRSATLRLAKKLGVSQGPNKQVVKVTRLGIKFPNYAALKAAFGRTTVDLFGINAPHMLQSLIVRVLGDSIPVGGSADTSSTEVANEATIGIYGQEAIRASAHNDGQGHMPRRHFLGTNSNDRSMIVSDIVARMGKRVRLALGGK